MRQADIDRSQGTKCKQAVDSLVRKDVLVKEMGFYRLHDQTIPASVLPIRTVVVMPKAGDIQKWKMEERETMKKELEKLRINLVDIRAYLKAAIDLLTPEEYKDQDMGQT